MKQSIKFAFEDIEDIREKLIMSQRTISVAESVTAGLLQAAPDIRGKGDSIKVNKATMSNRCTGWPSGMII